MRALEGGAGGASDVEISALRVGEGDDEGEEGKEEQWGGLDLHISYFYIKKKLIQLYIYTHLCKN